MNSQNWKIWIGILLLTFIVIESSASAEARNQTQPQEQMTSPQKVDWSLDVVELIQRSEKFFDLTFQANDLMSAGQVEKAQALYQQILSSYSDLDKTGYVAIALEECFKKLGKKPEAVKAASEPSTMTGPPPAKVLDLQTISVRYVHPVGKTRIIRTTMKILGTNEMENNPPERNWSRGIFEIHYTCRKVNPDGTGIYEVSMPLEEQMVGSGKGSVTIRNEKGKPASASRGENINPQLSNPKFQEAIGNVRAQVTFTMIVAPDGTPLKIEGYRESFDKQLANALKDIGPLTKFDEQRLASIKQATTDESMLKQMKLYRPKLPVQKSLHIGDTWKVEKFPNLEYRLLSIEMFKNRPCAKIQIHMAASVWKKTSPNEKSQSESRNSESNGYLYLDYEKGEILLEEKTYNFEFKQTIKGPQLFHLRQTGNTFSKKELIER